jgi:uncharacterized protein (DUF2267 family)
MSQARPDPFNHAVHTANIWLADVSSALGTTDRRFTRRAVRAWLHTLRDRLTVNAAAKFGQQLPELLRGEYYDGWEPSRVPVRYTADRYLLRFATEALIPVAEAPDTAAAITEVLAAHMSPGQLAQTLAELPVDLRRTISGGTEVPATAPIEATIEPQHTLEDRVAALTEAVRVLAHGLEDGPMTSSTDQAHVTRAARLADEILIAAGT